MHVVRICYLDLNFVEFEINKEYFKVTTLLCAVLIHEYVFIDKNKTKVHELYMKVPTY